MLDSLWRPSAPNLDGLSPAKAHAEAKGGILPDRYDEPSTLANVAAGESRSRRDTKEIVMPRQKDLKRIVRLRMKKTGESYTTARLYLVKTKPDYAAIAGMSDAAVKKQTGSDWAQWVAALNAVRATEKTHREITTHIHSLGINSWWSQLVTVGYERIRGLRDRGQQRGGSYRASKSRTFGVPVA